MATQVLFQEQLTSLNQLIQSWDRRLRARQTSLWLPRALVPGLALGVAIALISRLRPWLLPQQIGLVAAAFLVIGVFIMLALVWLWPRSSQQAAQRFDQTFGLKERISTALELINGRIHSNEELVSLQIGDAWEQARTVQPGAALPLVWNWREWAVVGVLAAILVVLLIIPNPQAEVLARTAAQAAEITAAQDAIQKITQDVATDPVLKPEDREELLKALQASSDILNQPDVTTEEAFATLSDAKAAVQDKTDQLNQDLAAQQAALTQAQSALQDFQPQNGQAGDASNQSSQPSASSAIQNALQNLSNLTAAQTQALAQALQQAAQSLQQTNPQAAQAMQQAAQALQQGDTSTAQQQLQQAQDALQRDAQNAQNQQTTSQQLSQNAQNIQQTAEQLSQSDQNQQNSQQQSQQQQSQQAQQAQNGQQQAQQGNQQSQQQGQQNQQSQNGQQQGQQQQGQQTDPNQQGQGQQGNQQSQQAQSSQEGQNGQQGQQGQNGNQPGQNGGQPSPNGQGGNQPGQSNPSQSIGGSGAGAGDNPGSTGSDQGGSQAQSGSSAQNNSPDGQGVGNYDPIYAPRRINGQGTEQIQLDPNASNNPVQEGEFAPNPNGEASVPYDQVFSDYSNDANRALESDYIPLGLRDVVKNYFSSLEPGQGSNPSSTR